MKRELKVGETFTCHLFNKLNYESIEQKNGKYKLNKKKLTTDILSNGFNYTWTDKKDGWTKSKKMELITTANDEERAKSVWVVTKTNSEGGGGSHNDYYTDGWHVTARRLKKDGTYDNKGEKVSFYQSGSFIGMIYPKDIELVGKMEKKIDFV